ncbi:Rv3654c family TadE-like protein [Kineococcus radiotolerans]|uniref:Putative Flp pilus-assembly TadG-like N-terminal domain-containing protein n=1 Tax=Kineococcus radiotolerans (strain ATCC BAA-149 / DSM 14245 / SRS30216) TaxID=266940 RepID=A6W582_KINRD|nr:Rv3654c family TadE-like protein [Kineococcus radiotolerans]ABS01971.1 hypothetical protein Krad_0481 [Kineococcus radiotolerans SRS30216 = ATCC BAA-149]
MSAAARPRRDTGSGGVLVLGTCAGLVPVVLLVSALGGAVLARHRAETAADLAALAAADVVVGRAVGDPCERARRVLTAHGADDAGCAVAGDGSVLVAATVRAPGLAGRLGPARARARAGQASGAPPGTASP